MAALSSAADHSLLWLGSAAVMALSAGDRGRQAAKRGLVADLLTSALVNGPLKLSAHRPRPRGRLRGIRRLPHSYSFPSGHSAAAFAFATAASRKLPPAGALLIPLASLVAYSRVYLGVHYPSDALVGAAIGTTLGLAVTPRPHRRRRG
jgi:membrane-associated phospholipid phosphatase